MNAAADADQELAGTSAPAAPLVEVAPSPLARVGAWTIRAYQLVLSPWVVQQCKYYPSCSAYALEAVQRHGALRGTRLAVWRVLRCNPWSRGGVDHVPGHPSSHAAEHTGDRTTDHSHDFSPDLART